MMGIFTRKKRPPLSDLLGDFARAYTIVSTTSIAQNAAQKSESDLLSGLNILSSGQFLNSTALSTTDQNTLARASVDAHIKKVQAAQLHDMGMQELTDLQAQSNTRFRNMPVTVTLHSKEVIFDALWFDPATGYRTSPFKKSTIKGAVEEVALDKNILVVRPTATMHAINRNLAAYIVYVIEPYSGRPAVTLTQK